MSSEKASNSTGLCPVEVEMSSQGIMSSEKASNSTGLCPVEGQKPSFDTQTRSQNNFSSLSLGVTKTSPPYLVIQCTWPNQLGLWGLMWLIISI